MNDTVDAKDREPARDEPAPPTRSIRPVIEHALTVYYDGNTELVQTLIKRLIAEQGGQ